MFEFIRLRYLAGDIDADRVRAYVPRWISTEQAHEIIESKQEG